LKQALAYSKNAQAAAILPEFLRAFLLPIHNLQFKTKILLDVSEKNLGD